MGRAQRRAEGELSIQLQPPLHPSGAGRARAAHRVPTQTQSEVTGQGLLLQEKQEAGPDRGPETRPKHRADVRPGARPGIEGTL